jgi:hypothetical protein
MTSIAPPGEHTAATSTVTVALVGSALAAEALQAALRALPGAAPGAWVITSEQRPEALQPVDIAVCDREVAAVVSRRWPDADVLAFVSAREEGGAVVAALESGAHVCVRGSDTALVAAYLYAIARRRGLRHPVAAR